VTFCSKFTIPSNSRKFPTEFLGNLEIPENSQREFRVAWILRIPGNTRMGSGVNLIWNLGVVDPSQKNFDFLGKFPKNLDFFRQFHKPKIDFF